MANDLIILFVLKEPFLGIGSGNADTVSAVTANLCQRAFLKVSPASGGIFVSNLNQTGHLAQGIVQPAENGSSIGSSPMWPTNNKPSE